MLYTFQQPVEGGYYYIVVRAKTPEEATHTIIDLVSTFEHLTGSLKILSELEEGTLVLSHSMQQQLDQEGYAYSKVATK